MGAHLQHPLIGLNQEMMKKDAKDEETKIDERMDNVRETKRTAVKNTM